MSKNIRMLIKIIAVAVCLLFLFLNTRRDGGLDPEVKIFQPEGVYARAEDVLILAEALNKDSGGREIIIRLSEKVSADPEAALTYADYQEIITAIAILPDVKFAGSYQPEHYFLASDWQAAAGEMIAIFNRTAPGELLIAETEMTILGLEDSVIQGATGEPLAPKQLLNTQMEIFAFKSSCFRKYPYQTVTALCQNGTLLTVTRVLAADFALKNTFFLGESAGTLSFFYQDFELRHERYPQDSFTVGDMIREQLADLYFADGRLKEINVKTEIIGGKLLSADEKNITVEGHGAFAVAADMQIYRLYEKLKTLTLKEMAIGYDFTDFVLADGEICGALAVRKAAMEHIRVALKTDNFAGVYHTEAQVSADTDFTVTYGPYDARERQKWRSGEVLILNEESDILKSGSVIITPAALTGKLSLLSVSRSQGRPAYRGTLEIKKSDKGLVIVNEVLLEEYLYSVVPSEMPASYPLEALKAQAVCARTYAYRYLEKAGQAALGAHVDDSVGYQVYNNIAENSSTTKAVRETAGQMLFFADSPAGTYYYSTSCGFGTTPAIWKSNSDEDTSYLQAAIIGADRSILTGTVNNGETVLTPDQLSDDEAFAGFITKKRPGDYEIDEPWYRWEYEVSDIKNERIAENMKKRYDINYKLVLTREKGEFISKPLTDFGDITDIYCAKRLPGGVMDELIIETTRNTFKIISENTIRYVLNDGDYKVTRHDGSAVASPSLLPSAFMIIETTVKDGLVRGYKLTGGGYGHGVGMAQNAARALGKAGCAYDEILAVFYGGCELKGCL